MSSTRVFWVLRCLLLILTVLPMTAARAWESGPESEEDEGPREAQRVPAWGYDFSAPQDPVNEHAKLLRLALARSGIPRKFDVDPASAFSLSTYSIGDDVEGGVKSVLPSSFRGVNTKNTRRFTLAGFASLPDHSYSLSDWASGNETCPPGTVLKNRGPHDCHSFKWHLGSVNSTHFPPQSESNYRWYHKLALVRAAACRDLGNRFSSSVFSEERAIQANASVQECEREALAIEAVGQHFLQDAWAIGHMWQRWGYASINDFPEGVGLTSSPSFFKEWTALTVAGLSGTIHGAEGLLKGIPDLLSAGEDPSVRWTSADGSVSGQGIGDVHLEDLLNKPAYALQRERLLNCSASGLRDVYEATAMYPKSDPGTAMGMFFGERVDPLSTMCLGQRATNASMLLGLLFQCGIDKILDVTLPESTRKACLALTIEARINIAAGLVSNFLDPVLATSITPPDLLAALKRDMVRISAWASFRAVKDPDGTDLAESAYADETAPVSFRGLLGVPKNAVAMNSSPPGPYADPEFPWPSGSEPDGDWTPARWLGRTFHQSHVAEWCDSEETNPQALVERVATLSDGPEKVVACEVCTEFVSRHIQLTSKPDTALCVAAGAISRPILAAISEASVKSAAGKHCKCDATWDAGKDFSATANPNGPWSYGWEFNYANFRTFPSTSAEQGTDGWREPLHETSGAPSIIRAHGNELVITHPVPTVGQPAGTVSFFPTEVVLHPAVETIPNFFPPTYRPLYAMLRFTAPEAGSYSVTAAYSSRNSVGATTQVGVLATRVGRSPFWILNFQEISSAKPSASMPQAQIIELAKGDVLDFIVAPAKDSEQLTINSMFYDSTGLNAQIKLVSPK